MWTFQIPSHRSDFTILFPINSLISYNKFLVDKTLIVDFWKRIFFWFWLLVPGSCYKHPVSSPLLIESRKPWPFSIIFLQCSIQMFFFALHLIEDDRLSFYPKPIVKMVEIVSVYKINSSASIQAMKFLSAVVILRTFSNNITRILPSGR